MISYCGVVETRLDLHGFCLDGLNGLPGALLGGCMAAARGRQGRKTGEAAQTETKTKKLLQTREITTWVGVGTIDPST